MKILLAFFTLSFLLVIPVYADTVRIPNAPGQGYEDVHTDKHGNEIARTKYSEDGKVKLQIEKEILSGNVTTTQYNEKGIPREAKTRDKDGVELKKEEFNDKGQKIKITTYDAIGFPTSETEYIYDEKGQMISVKVTHHAGATKESYDYGYDQDGNLVLRVKRKNGNIVGQLETDKEGKVIAEKGDVKDIDRHQKSAQKLDKRSHVTKNKYGHTITVRHNEDESFDIIIQDRYGRIISLHHNDGGECYLRGDCPLEEE